ncbi:MAG TPA: c-type cytochrome [Candidatus Limnocylindria bacterium]|nr:c-type cytochrome [Candidatus Limnocylindria bacterium]
MNGNRQKLWIAVCGTSLGLLLAIAGAGAQSTAPNAPAAPAGPKLAEEEFKNIQALKGIPADQLIPSMQFIAASLGVECEYCHVAHANEKDDKKPKVTARKMINMMMAINKDNFEGHREVTCYSCHRGSKDPVATPIITDEEAKLAAEGEKKPDEAKAMLPSAEQLLDKYLAAIGGADALQKITSRVQKGTITAFGGQHFPVDVYSKAPDKRLSVMHLQGGDSFTGFDGKQGWLSVPGRVHTMSAAENAAARIDADLYLPAHLKTLYEKFRVDIGEKIDGHDTYVVAGRTEGQPPLRLYLDKESGLLLRLVRYAETPLGRNPTQIDYADYRDANGVKVPFRWTLARPGNRFTIQIEQLQQNVAVDDSKFLPPPPSAAPKPSAP